MSKSPNNRGSGNPDEERELLLSESIVQLEKTNRQLRKQLRKQKKIEDKLRESEEKLRTIFEHANDAIAYTTTDGKVVDANPKTEEIFGYKLEEVIGRNFTEFGILTPKDMKRSLESLSDIASGKPGQMMEFETIRKDGKRLFVEVNSRLVKREDERKGVLNIIRDVTRRKHSEMELARHQDHLEELVKARTIELESANSKLKNEIEDRKRTEKELRESEEKFKTIFDSANDEIVFVGTDGTILDVNQKIEDIFAYKPEEVIGRNFGELEFFRREEKQKRMKQFQDAIHGKFTKGKETEVLRKDGKPVTVEFSFRTIKKEGLPEGLLCILRDITDRKRAQEALRKSEEHFRALIDNASDIIVILEADGRIRYISPAAERVLGHTLEATGGRSGFDFVPQEGLSNLMKGFRSALKNPGVKPPIEISVRHKDGSWRTLEVIISNLLNNTAVEGIVINSRDITERKRVEEELQKYRSHLEELVDERTTELETANRQLRDEIEERKRAEKALKDSEKRLQFLSSRLFDTQELERRRLSRELHDEMGQDLALLKLRIRSIEKQLPEDQASAREACEETNRCVDQIIENVRRISRDLRPSILDDLGLTAALRWLAEDFERQHPVKMSLEFMNVDSFLSREAQINTYRICQEILTNIGKHARANHVNFTIHGDRRRLSFSIHDDGTGFDVGRVSTRGFDQRGMGLTAMNERAHMLRGILNIDSQAGRGSRITLSIPIGSVLSK